VISHAELKRIASLQSDDGILSVYIKLDPRLRTMRDQAATKFKGAMTRFLRNASEGDAKVAQREEERVLESLSGREFPGRSVVIFSSTPADIWELLNLEVFLPTTVQVDTTTGTGLLARVVDEYPRFAVAIVQRDRAEVFLSEQRAGDEAASIESDVPGQHDQGGWSQARFQRHIEVHVDRHLDRLVEELESLQRTRAFNRLVLGGPDEVVKRFRGMLSREMEGMVVGTFPVSLKHDSESDVLGKARAAIRDHEGELEKALVSRLNEAAEAGGRAVLGIPGSLAAVQDGRVDTLVVADGVTETGAECLSCGYVAAGTTERCPRCGGDVEAVADVVERAVETALRTDAHIELVLGEAREWLLSRGGMGAALRY
jgi:peptide chain release factor subunit 1